ncbi:MAG: hypothetical protein V1824_01200 [archaeon]
MITTKNIEKVKKGLEAITNLIQDTNVRFKDSGIYIKSVDKSQIILVDFCISKSCFDTYSIEPNLIGINILELQNMISRSFEKDKLSLDLKEQYLEVYLKGKIERKFKLPYLDLSETALNNPDIKFDAVINMDAFLLKEILKDISLVGTTLTLKINNGNLLIEATGEKGTINTTVPDVAVKCKKNFSSKFSLGYLKNITKSIESGTIVTIKLAEDAPLYLEYKIDNDIEVKFYLSGMLI